MDSNSPIRGKFITLEGLEGVGKTTNRTFVEALLNEHNIEFVGTREPGGTELGESLRNLVLPVIKYRKKVTKRKATSEAFFPFSRTSLYDEANKSNNIFSICMESNFALFVFHFVENNLALIRVRKAYK